MQVALFRFAGLILTGAALIVVGAGCGGQKRPGAVRVNGRVVEKGSPLKLGENAFLVVKFLDPAGTVYATQVKKEDASFVIVGPEGEGIVPGTYKVSVMVVDPYPKGKDKYKGKFADDKTPITKEVTGKEEIVIDLAS